MNTKVVHLKKEAYDIDVSRPSKWGNIYSHKEGTAAEYIVSTREDAVRKYRHYLFKSGLYLSLPELKGKILGCWCSPLACHGDVLSYYADCVMYCGRTAVLTDGAAYYYGKEKVVKCWMLTEIGKIAVIPVSKLTVVPQYPMEFSMYLLN